MENVAGGGEGDIAEGNDLRVMPAILFIPVHRKHMIGKDLAESKLRIFRFLFRRVRQLNFDFHIQAPFPVSHRFI